MDPLTAITVGSLLLGGAKTLLGNKAQNDAAEANAEAAKLAQREASKDISLLQIQETDRTARTIFEADRAARSTQALARVSAGEAGVSGVSVEALLGDIDRKRGEFRTASAKNLDMALEALQREKISGRNVAQARIASVQPANPWATALEIGGIGLEFWAGQISRKPTS